MMVYFTAFPLPPIASLFSDLDFEHPPLLIIGQNITGMQEITADYDTDEDDESQASEMKRRYLPCSSLSSSSTQPSSNYTSTPTATAVNSYFKPGAGSAGDVRSSTSSERVALKPKAITRKGTKRVFKQIEICASDDADSDDEEDYVPKKNYNVDSDDGSSPEPSDQDSRSDNEDKLERINEDLPEKSKLDRKRKTRTSKGVYKRSISKARSTTRKNAKCVYDRAKEFSESGLTVVAGKLCCRACGMQEIALKSSSIKSHITGETHENNMKRRDKSQLTMLSYKALVAENETEEKAAGATLPLNVNAYRMSVAHALLKTGMPFTMLDSGCEIRLLLEDYHAICPKQACSDMIPLLRKKEHVETISELNEAAAFSISSDGTINVAESLAVVSSLRFKFPQKNVINITDQY